MSLLRQKSFGGIVTGKSALAMKETESPDCSNVRIDNPYGALNTDIGMTKWSSAGVGNPINAIWQLRNKRITYLEDAYWAIDEWEYGDNLNPTLGALMPLNQVCRSQSWSIIACNPLTGDMYALDGYTTLYRQIGALGDFQEYHVFDYSATGLAISINGDIYVTINGIGIYVQTSGTGNFNLVYSSVENLLSMCAAPNGDIYSCRIASGEGDGGVYKRTGGVGNFVSLNLPNRDYYGICATPNGDIYVTIQEVSSAILKQTGGVGDFVDLNQINILWFAITSNSDGDIYACTYQQIYKQTAGVGDFISINEDIIEETTNFNGLAFDLNDNLYACVFGDDIYKATLS